MLLSWALKQLQTAMVTTRSLVWTKDKVGWEGWVAQVALCNLVSNTDVQLVMKVQKNYWVQLSVVYTQAFPKTPTLRPGFKSFGVKENYCCCVHKQKHNRHKKQHCVIIALEFMYFGFFKGPTSTISLCNQCTFHSGWKINKKVSEPIQQHSSGVRSQFQITLN